MMKKNNKNLVNIMHKIENRWNKTHSTDNKAIKKSKLTIIKFKFKN
jgi:hypothetical protein